MSAPTETSSARRRSRALQLQSQENGAKRSVAHEVSKTVQKKTSGGSGLTIGQPGDRYEQEADAVADTIVKSPTPETTAQGSEASGVDVSPSTEGNQVHRKPNHPSSFGNPQSPGVPNIQAAFESEEAPPDVQAKLYDTVQRSGADDDGGEAPSGLDSQLSSTRGGGSPLPESSRSQMEPHLGDLGGVRVHTDSQAAEMSSSIGARAFTHGQDIYFNEGEYNPGSTDGQHLLAHEATHTVQQTGGVAPKLIQREEAAAPATEEQPLDLSFEDTAAPPPTPEAIEKAQEAGKVDTGAPGPEEAVNALPPPAPDTAPAEGQADKKEEQKPEGEAAPEGEEKKGKEGPPAAADNPGNTTLNHLNAPASQMARNQSQVSGQVSSSMQANRQTTQAAMPPLKADNTGQPKEGEGEQEGKLPEGQVGPLGDGVTGAEPPPAQKGQHQDLGPAPDPQKNNQVLDKQKVAAFLSWFKNNFGGFSRTIKTKDPNVNTSAGERPSVPQEGKADPNRADEQKKESDQEVGKQTDEAKSAIEANPGKENIQPQDVTEEKPVNLSQEVAEVTAERTQEMDDFLNLNLPPDVQALTDETMQPKLDATLAAEKSKVSEAQQTQIADTEAEQTKAQEETAKLNEEAARQQKETVAQNRAEVQASQDQGKKDAEGLMADFDSQSSEKQKKAKEDIDKEVKAGEKKADEELKKGEKKAGEKKRKEEAKAAAKKREMEKESESDSWWDRAVNAVKSAVKAVTSAIGTIFKALREAVTAIIDAAKDLALKAIEAARKFAVAALDALGSVLKGLVNTFIGSLFPGLAKRINEAIDATVNKAKEAVNAIADGLKKGVEALAEAAKAAVNKILEVMETAITAAVQIVGALVTGDFTEALKIAIKSACKIAGIDPKPVFDFIERAGDTLMTILKNPVQFVKNLAKGVGGGIDLFKKNIKQHLINGVIGWLGGAMSDVPLQLPDKWDLKGIFSLVMQILGLTYDRLRAKIVKEIGPKGEQIVGTIEKGAEVAGEVIGLLKQMYVEKSFMPLWELIQGKWQSIKEQAMEKIRGVITLEVVKAGVKWLIGLLNPASAIVKAVIMIFDVTMFIIERKDQIVDMIQSIYGAIAPIARGETGAASKAVEAAMGRSVPVILGMLASVLGLGGIGKSVSKVLKSIQKQVDKVVDPIIKKIVTFAKKAFKSGKAGLKKLKDKIFQWWKKAKPFKTASGEKHTITFSGAETTAKLVIKSAPRPAEEFLAKVTTNIDQLKKDKKITAAQHAAYKKQIKKANGLMDGIKKDKASINKKKNTATYNTFSKTRGEEIAKKMTVLAGVLALLPESATNADDVSARPKSVISWPGQQSTPAGTKTGLTQASIDGQAMVADVLSLDGGGHSGSSPGYTSPLHDAVNSRRKNVYIRGHLLNHHLHGTGADAKNLGPITGKANTNMSAKVEEKLKNAVLKDNKVVYYKVVFGYDRGSRPAPYIPAEGYVVRKITMEAKELAYKHPAGKPQDAETLKKEKADPKNWKGNIAGNVPGLPAKTVLTSDPPTTEDPGAENVTITPALVSDPAGMLANIKKYNGLDSNKKKIKESLAQQIANAAKKVQSSGEKDEVKQVTQSSQLTGVDGALTKVVLDELRTAKIFKFESKGGDATEDEKKHQDIVNQAITQIDGADNGEDIIEVVEKKKEIAKQQEVEGNKKLKPGVKLTITVDDSSAVETGKINITGKVAPNTTLITKADILPGGLRKKRFKVTDKTPAITAKMEGMLSSVTIPFEYIVASNRTENKTLGVKQSLQRHHYLYLNANSGPQPMNSLYSIMIGESKVLTDGKQMGKKVQERLVKEQEASSMIHNDYQVENGRSYIIDRVGHYFVKGGSEVWGGMSREAFLTSRSHRMITKSHRPFLKEYHKAISRGKTPPAMPQDFSSQFNSFRSNYQPAFNSQLRSISRESAVTNWLTTLI